MTAEPVIRIPACRKVSPMNPNTRPLKTLTTILPQNLDASPNEIKASSGRERTFIYLGVLRMGWVASSVCVKT